MMARKNGIVLLTLLAFIVQVAPFKSVFAQPVKSPGYRVAVGDKVFISVPQRADLNRNLVVKKNGTIALPIAGDLRVEGLTLAELETRVYQALKEYYPSITSVDVTITGAAELVVYVIGQVGDPGKYDFVSPPNLWEAIREAGGPTSTASLDDVRIVSGSGGGSQVVNVQIALERGTVDQLPPLNDGDTVILQDRPVIYSGSLGVSVFGAVVKPGSYKLQGKRDLLTAILLAGGPTKASDLSKIKIIRATDNNTVLSFEVDLRNYLKVGDPAANPRLSPGDTVHIPEQNRLSMLLKNDASFLLSLITTGVTVAALIVSINK
jgi:polysaccharide export outer membrane protein